LFTQADDNVKKGREKLVGGSEIPALLGISKYKTQFDLALEKTMIKPSDFTGNEYTEYGNVMEPQIRDYINALNGTFFVPDTKIDRNRGMRSNTDGYDAENNLILEIKTHGKSLDIKPYVAQMQLYMYQFGVEYGWLALYQRPDNFDVEFDAAHLEIKVIERDQEYIDRILNAIDTFWIRCEYLKENPEMTEKEFMSFGQNEIQVLAREVEKVELQVIDLEVLMKKIETQRKELKDKLYAAMDEYDIKKWETDKLLITRVLPGQRESFDSTKFKKDYPDLAEQYKKISKVAGSVRIKVKEAN
jgi:putative phage-type endonuclease